METGRAGTALLGGILFANNIAAALSGAALGDIAISAQDCVH
jgi:hypothetical protein